MKAESQNLDAYSLFLVDLDGTLANSLAWWQALCPEYLLKKTGQSLPEEINAELEALDLHQAAIYLKSLYPDLPEAAEMEQELEAIMLAHYARDIQPLPGARELLETLHEKGRVYLATMSQHACAAAFLKAHDLDGFVNGILAADSFPYHKNTPVFYTAAASALQGKAEKILLLDDSAAALQAARTAGLAPAGIVYGRDAQAIRKLQPVSSFLVFPDENE